jgi:hypothetical protein
MTNHPFQRRVKTRKLKPNKRAKLDKTFERIVKLDSELKQAKNQ